ncbi:hypothetical protein VDG1235_3520 [Verrucomicrobiia bacterium DG1235]|nr:hypothetical protein VDG1235_3520 [Verrucomicrobiae bacterium DG1235]
MEGLLIIGAELLLLPFIAGITALCELALGLASLILQLIFGTTIKASASAPRKMFRLSPAAIKWIQRIALGSLAIFTAALLLLNFVFLEQTVRFAVNKVETKTGFEIEYESMEGNLFTGAFAFEGLDITQTLAEKPQLSIQAQSLAANLSVWNFIFGSRVVDSASLSEASITLQTIAKPEEEKKSVFAIGLAWNENRLDGLTAGPASLVKTPNYTIKDLKLSKLSIHVDDRSSETPTNYDIAIDHFEAQPLRSHFAIFDLLFRSNLDGTLNGSRLTISNTESDGHRHTKWATQDVPAGVLASLIGGPFSLFEAGTVDVEVTDQWEAERVESLELDWKIKVADAQARLPQATPKLLQPLAQVWVDNINQTEKDWEFGFQLQLSENQFKGKGE